MLTCLEETIYHGISWWDRSDSTVRVPVGAKLADQPFGRRSEIRSAVKGVVACQGLEPEDVEEGAQLILARLGLSRAHGY